jgi:hypothetical protein
MKHFVNLIMTGALICATCFTSCKDDESENKTVRSVTPTQSTVSVLEGSTTTIAATVTPNEAGQEITWTIENSDIATIVDRGRINGISASSVTGVSPGSTTVTATSVSDPGKKATIQVTVTKHIDSVMLDIDDMVILVLGATETATVEATIMPADAIQTVTWTSSNTNVATVANGVIRATGTGVAIITATSTSDPSKTATVEVETVSLVNRVIHTVSKFGNELIVDWANMGSGDLIEFLYTNDAGQPASTIVPVTPQSSYIMDFGSVPLSYRTLYFSKGTVQDTLRAPLVNVTGTIYDLSATLSMDGWTATASSYEGPYGEWGLPDVIFQDGFEQVWHTRFSGSAAQLPHWIEIDMQNLKSITRLEVLRYTDIKTLHVIVSETQVTDKSTLRYMVPAATLEFPGPWNRRNEMRYCDFEPPLSARYIYFYMPDTHRNPYASIESIKVFGQTQ